MYLFYILVLFQTCIVEANSNCNFFSKNAFRKCSSCQKQIPEVCYVDIKKAEILDSFDILWMLVPLGDIFSIFCKIMNSRCLFIISRSGILRNAV